MSLSQRPQIGSEHHIIYESTISASKKTVGVRKERIFTHKLCFVAGTIISVSCAPYSPCGLWCIPIRGQVFVNVEWKSNMTCRDGIITQTSPAFRWSTLLWYLCSILGQKLRVSEKVWFPAKTKRRRWRLATNRIFMYRRIVNLIAQPNCESWHFSYIIHNYSAQSFSVGFQHTFMPSTSNP